MRTKLVITLIGKEQLPLPLQTVCQRWRFETMWFHQKRLKSLAGLKLKKVLQRKNPSLYKAKFVISAPDLVCQKLRRGEWLLLWARGN